MKKRILTPSELNELKIEIYGNAVTHGFYDDELAVEHYLGLAMSDFAGAIIADRNPDTPHILEATLEQAKLLADESIGRVAFVEFYKKNINGSVIDKLADAAICIMSLAGELKINFDDDLEVDDIESNGTFPEKIFEYSMSLANLNFDFVDQDDFLSCLECISSLALHFAHLDLWQMVRLKMIYNKTRPMLYGMKY